MKGYKITKQEYLEFFDLDITVRRKQELAKKIFKRVNHLEQLVGTRIFSSWIELYYEWREVEKDKDTIANNEGSGIYSWEADLHAPIEALWGDDFIKQHTLKVKESEKEVQEAEQTFRKQVSSILSKLTEEEAKFIVDNKRSL